MKVHRGKVHKYLGMSLDFSHKWHCIVTMHDYVDLILKAYDVALAKYDDGVSPVFTVNEDCEKLLEDMATDFHTIIAKTLYVTKRARPDMCLSIAYLTTRVREALS